VVKNLPLKRKPMIYLKPLYQNSRPFKKNIIKILRGIFEIRLGFESGKSRMQVHGSYKLNVLYRRPNSLEPMSVFPRRRTAWRCQMEWLP
jgi:hypothetical protein